MQNESTEFDYKLLLDLTNKLTQLVNLEAELLTLMKVSEIKSIQAEKNKVAGKLEIQQNLLRSSPEFRARLSDTQKDELRAAAIGFDIAIQKYQEQLFKAQKVNQFILGKMVDAVREHVEKNRSYNKKGLKIASGIELAKNTPAMKFNAQV